MLFLTIIFLATLASIRAADPCAGLKDGAFLNSPSGDCQAYVTCVNGISHPARCPDGFLFDKARQMCNWPSLVTTCPCYGKPDNTFLPRPEGGCAAYYACVGGQGSPLTCPPNYYFDPVKNICNYPELVNCVATTTTTTTTTKATSTTAGGTTTTGVSTTTASTTTTGVTPPTVGTTTTGTGTTTTTVATTTTPAGPNPCSGRNNVFVTDPNGDCQAYFSCVDGVAHSQRCPTGFSFDVAKQYCNFWSLVDCGDPTNPCYHHPQYSFVPRLAGTCSSYYRCEYGVGVPFECPNGLFFDVRNNSCNHPDRVDCKDGTAPTAPTVATTTTAPTTTTTTTTTTTSTTRTTTQTTTIPTVGTPPPTTTISIPTAATPPSTLSTTIRNF